MSKTLVMVGTRKGCFLLESDERRPRVGAARARSARAGRSTTPSTTPTPARSTRPRASEWHGASVWRSPDLGETWTQSSEGLEYGDSGLKLSKVSGLTAAHGRLFAGAETPGVFESRDGGQTWTVLSDARRPAGQRRRGTTRRTSRPGHLGVPAILPHPDDPARYWAIVQGFGIFETTDDGASWTPRNKGLRADWPLENPEVGYCVHKLVMSPVDNDRLYQQNHVGMHRSDDAGLTWTEISDGLPSEFGFAAARAPARPRHVLRDPARPRPRALHARRAARRSGARVTRARRGSGSTDGLPQQDAYVGVLREGMAIDTHDVPGLYFGTSTGQLFASADEGESWREIASYLPGIASVEVAIVD